MAWKFSVVKTHLLETRNPVAIIKNCLRLLRCRLPILWRDFRGLATKLLRWQRTLIHGSQHLWMSPKAFIDLKLDIKHTCRSVGRSVVWEMGLVWSWFIGSSMCLFLLSRWTKSFWSTLSEYIFTFRGNPCFASWKWIQETSRYCMSSVHRLLKKLFFRQLKRSLTCTWSLMRQTIRFSPTQKLRCEGRLQSRCWIYPKTVVRHDSNPTTGIWIHGCIKTAQTIGCTITILFHSCRTTFKHCRGILTLHAVHIISDDISLLGEPSNWIWILERKKLGF